MDGVEQEFVELSKGSPPVKTTNLSERSPCQVAAIAAASSAAVSNLPPPSPSVPTKSVSQNRPDGLGAVGLAAVPQIATRETAEHRAARPA